MKTICVGSAVLFTLFVFGFGLIGCSSPTSSNGATPTNTWGQARGIAIDTSGNVYLAGRVGTSTTACVPCYWKNGTLTLLPMGSGNTFGKGSHVTIDGLGNVYISGQVGTSSSQSNPCYWKNGASPTILPLGSGNSEFWYEWTTVDPSNNFYLGGAVGTSSSTPKACYWKGTTLNVLPLFGTDTTGLVNGIVYNSGHLYASGYSASGMCTWVDNSSPVILPWGSGMTWGGSQGIAFDASSNEYVVGYEGTSSSAYQPCYWKNSTAPVFLPLGSDTYGDTVDVACDSSGANVYITGSTGSSTSTATWVPCYWKNGVKASLPFGTGIGLDSDASNVIVDSSGNFYISGEDGTATSTTPCYWKNGTLNLLPMN